MSLAAGLLFFALLALLVVGGLAGPPLVVALRRARVMRRPFPAAWREWLRHRMPLYNRLPAHAQLRLKKRAQVLLAEVPFIGCGGLEVTEEMRVLIAAQAALLLAGRGPAFRNLRQVLVYPGHFAVERSHTGADGVVHEARQVMSGESWQQGQVVLAWESVLEGAAIPDDGANVVIHEFAHQLDQETGPANGAPFLGRHGRPERWKRVLGDEFAQLQSRVARGEPGLIDAYAATNAAEFFAVVSEFFFEQPAALAEAHPALYAEFARCYRQDPLSW
jgi:Mlc titration factor MtfA (ptsG expression regulator)